MDTPLPEQPQPSPETAAIPAAAVDPIAAPPSVPAGTKSSSLRFAIAALCLGLVVIGAIWRFVDLDYPRTFTFDEHHFVRNARNYIAHQADWNDHPPLGKLVLVPGIRVFGDRGLGWRVSSAIFGLALIALAGLCGTKIFNDRRAGMLAASFVAIDGFFLSYARSALIDNPLTFFIYAALALMLWARSLAWFAGAALCVGLAVSCKWTGVCVLLLAPLLLRRGRKSMWHVLWMFGLASLVYLAIGAAALVLTRQPIAMASMLRTNWDLLQHHAGFTVWDNAASSKWYSWPFLTHPIITHREDVGRGLVRVISTIGNLLLWFATTAAMLLALVGLGRSLYRRLRHHLPIPDQARHEGLALAAMAALVLPFMITNRQSYIFHYLGAYGLGLGLLASRLARLEKRSAAAVLGFLVCATAVSFFYLPVWTGTPMSAQGFHLRLPFPGWR